MKTITLTQNKVAIVDNADYEKINQFKWYAAKNYHGKYLAVRQRYCFISKKQHTVLMSRQIMSCPTGMCVDHKNHNKLDNRQENLRICTNTENGRNSSKPKNNTSGFKGVCWHKGRIYNGKQYTGKWQAAITFNNKRIYIGFFNNKIEAAKAYDKKAKELFGEFANLNFKEN